MKSSWKFGGVGGLAAVTITAVLTGLYLEPEPASELRDAQEAATGAPQQQIAKPDPASEKDIDPTGPSTGPSTGGGGTTVDEICGNGIDDDGDGRIDEAPPPEPGVNWNRCDISGDDYTGENLRGATMFRIIAVGTTFNEADLSNVRARGGDFSYSIIHDATIIRGHFQDTDLTHTEFRRSNMEGINLNGAELSDASFLDADLRNASLNAVTFATDRVHGINGDYTGASFNNIDGLKAFFYSTGFGTTSLVDTTFFDTTTHNVKLHDSSLQLADFRDAIVQTGILEFAESRLTGYWWYNANTLLDCINHVICNNPPPESFRDIYQVEPEPETFRDVKINPYESWYGMADGHEHEYYCYELHACYHPQVATILSGGTVNWIYDKDDVPTHTTPTRKIIIEPESEDLRSFSSPNIEPGERWSHTFSMPGKYHYYDEFNPDWVGQVIVFGKIIEGSGDKPDNPPTENPPKDPPENPPEKPPQNPPPENPPN